MPPFLLCLSVGTLLLVEGVLEMLRCRGKCHPRTQIFLVHLTGILQGCNINCRCTCARALVVVLHRVDMKCMPIPRLTTSSFSLVGLRSLGIDLSHGFCYVLLTHVSLFQDDPTTLLLRLTTKS